MGTGSYSREFIQQAEEILFGGRTAYTPTSTYVGLLASGASVTEPATLSAVVAQELSLSGYARQRLGIQLSSITSNTITTAVAHNQAAGTAGTFANTGGALPTGISAGTRYYVISTGLTSTAFQISTTSGGSAATISGGSGTNLFIPSGIYDTVDKRIEIPKISLNFTPTADGAYQGLFIAANATGTTGNTTGVLIGYEVYASPINLFNGQTFTVELQANIANIGTNTGV